jgi:hypothetical protein
MTTAVTVKAAGLPVYVYECALDEEKSGWYALAATLKANEERTFYVHSSNDVMVTENLLDE